MEDRFPVPQWDPTVTSVSSALPSLASFACDRIATPGTRHNDACNIGVTTVSTIGEAAAVGLSLPVSVGIGVGAGLFYPSPLGNPEQNADYMSMQQQLLNSGRSPFPRE